jgi:LysM repeat protein
LEQNQNEKVEVLTKKAFSLVAVGSCLLVSAACGYNPPEGSGTITPYVIIVTPTPTINQLTTQTTTTSNSITTTNTTTAQATDTTTIAVATPTSNLPTHPYTVQKGDTILTIAKQFGVSADLLVKVNSLDDADKLQIGQVLQIPPPKPKTPGA